MGGRGGKRMKIILTSTFHLFTFLILSDLSYFRSLNHLLVLFIVFFPISPENHKKKKIHFF